MPSLHEFGEAVQCDYTTASRLLSGDRAPSTSLLSRICDAYGLDHGNALRVLAADKLRGGRTTGFAAFLRDNVFQTTSSVHGDPLVKETTP